MSREIDERIVQMQFDNAQFEAGVKTTLGTLDRLKESLSFSGTEQSGMAALQNNVAAISDRFSALGIVATTVLQNIANKAVDVGSRLLKSLTIEGAMDGFGEYELKLDSVQTIMSGTGESLATVSKYLEELNTYADKTIYSFSDMTSSIGKFTNAGVGLDQAVKAIQGVSNEAALSGANAQQASHAMYNFAQALSSGAVKLIDWKSIENANMATKEFKEELIKTAVELGTLKKKGDQYVSTTKNMQGKTSDAFDAVHNFNDSLQAQWMTTDVLVQTLGRYADETTDIGRRAFAAAQDVKTFSQLIDTLKEAVGSGWATSFEIIVGNFDEAKELWTAVSNEIGAIVDRQSKARNDLLQGWKDAGGRSELIGAFRNIWDAINSYVKPIKEAFNDIFSPVGPLRLAGLSEQFKIFTSHLRLSDEAMLNLHNTFRGVFSVFDIVLQPIQALLRVFADYMDIIPDVEYGLLEFTGGIGDFIAGIADSARESDIFYKALSKIIDILKIGAGGIGNVIAALKPYIPSVDELSGRLGGLAEKVSPLAALFDKAKQSVAAFFDSFRRDRTAGAEETTGLFGNLLIFFGKIMAVAQKAGLFIGGLFQKIGQALGDVFTGLDFDRVLDILNGFMTVGIGAGIANFIHSLSELTSGAGDFMGGLTDILDGVTGSLEAFQTKLKAEALVPIAVAIGVLTASLVALSASDHSRLADALGALTTMFVQLGVFMAAFIKMVNGMEEGDDNPKGLGDRIQDMVKGVLGIGGDDDDKLGAAAKAMITLAGAVLVLSAAVAILSNLSWEELAKGLLAVTVLMAELTASAMILSKSEGKRVKGAAGLVIFAAAIRVLSGAVVSMS